MVGFKAKQEPVLDMRQLAKRIEEPQEVLSYAPPRVRGVPMAEQVIEHVAKFTELPTSELDEMVNAAEDEIKTLKEEAQYIRDVYSRYSNKLTEDIKRLREGVRLSMETMQTLRDQCTALDSDLAKFEKPKTLQQATTQQEKSEPV